MLRHEGGAGDRGDARGRPRQYFNASLALVTLLQELNKHAEVRYVQVQRGGDSLLIQK
ncbi:MAG: hypothetical protein HY848_06190 [Betaproteobacteria bacterium]|nr:hypothetical protein [Betaproteobacteria bacterium]